MVLRNFVAFEGSDGSGTSTQIGRLRERLSALSPAPAFHLCFEPTDGVVGSLVRSALRRDVALIPETVARLFAADRCEHLYSSGGIVERCERGELVVSDRYVPSSLVYQGLDCGDLLPARLNEGFPHPELVIYFDLDPSQAFERYAERPVKDIYERIDFQIQVRERYAAVLPAYAEGGSRILRVDASRSVREVAEQVWSAMTTLPILGG